METGRRIRRAVLFLCLAAVAVGGLRIGFAAFSGREGAEEEALQTAFALLWRGQYPRVGNPDGSQILEMAFSLSPLCRLGMETLEERSREESQDPAFAAYLENRDFLAAYGRAAPAREKAGADPGTGTDPAAGMDPEMPAALLIRGTTAHQRRIVASVSTLEEEVNRQGAQTPAIIVVGKVCALAEEFAWYENLPLAGYKVLVTRPKDLISTMSVKLRTLGAEVLELPAIRTEPLEDQRELHQAFNELDTYDWAAFTSPTGVKIFFEELLKTGTDIRKLGGIRIAAIGKGTEKALKERGLIPDLIPEIYDGASLGKALREACCGEERILIPRAKIGNHEILEELEKKPGLRISDIATYDTFYEKQEIIDEKKEFEQGGIDCAVFTSASTVRGFAAACPDLDYTKVTAACIGKQTKAAADSYGMKTYMAEKATIDSVLELVIRLKEKEC